MAYRTKTYIAADWDGDNDAVKQLYKWKNNNYWGLDFHDAHNVTQARDGSLNCSIKASLQNRMDISKTFVLIVGDGTRSRRAGNCYYCHKYIDCTKQSNKSYLEYECDKAVRDGLKIVVLYNSSSIDKSKCLYILKYVGTHEKMKTFNAATWSYDWDYQTVKSALGQ